MVLNAVLGSLTFLSFILAAWQWVVGRRFPLHRRNLESPFQPPITLFKPLKGADAATEECLRSWFLQDYGAPIQILFAVASAEDPVCPIVRKLLAQFPNIDAQLITIETLSGSNAKVSKLAQLEALAKHELICISDADVRVPADFLRNAVAQLANERVGLVNSFYQLANPSTMAAELTRLNQRFIDSLASEYSKTIVAIAILFVPLLPPTADINIDAIKGNARLAVYVKALEKHLGKASRAKKLQLTPQKRRAHATVGGSRLKQTHQEDAFEREDEEMSQEELGDDNDYHGLQTSPVKSELGTNLFRQMALGYEDGGASDLCEDGGASDLYGNGGASDIADSPMPLRKRTILRS